MAAAAFLNSQATAGQALSGTTSNALSSNGTVKAASTTSSTSSSSSSTATITADDFITLLVAEMKNQDPTADTDPNAYIDQLVQVNSLEQLIDINSTLTSDLSTSTTSTSSSKIASASQTATSSLTAASATGTSAAAQSDSSSSASPNSTVQHTSGNLSVPAANSSAERVAHALSGQ